MGLKKTNNVYEKAPVREIVKRSYVTRQGQLQDPQLTVCPKCDNYYGFVRCRITKSGKSQCLQCAILAEKEGTF